VITKIIYTGSQGEKIPQKVLGGYFFDSHCIYFFFHAHSCVTLIYLHLFAALAFHRLSRLLDHTPAPIWKPHNPFFSILVAVSLEWTSWFIFARLLRCSLLQFHFFTHVSSLSSCHHSHFLSPIHSLIPGWKLTGTCPTSPSYRTVFTTIHHWFHWLNPMYFAHRFCFRVVTLAFMLLSSKLNARETAASHIIP